MGIRVLLAEDNALLRQGLERLIAHDSELELVGSVADLPSLQKSVVEAEPDVVVSDIRMPPTKTDEGIQMAAQAGVTAIIQPGGSIRDEMAIEVADRHHLAMVFTGRRHFRH